MKKLLLVCSAALALMAGAPSAASAADLPYEITFTQSNISSWTILDVNADGDNFGARKWGWTSSAFCYNLVSSQVGPANDWAISPAFQLEAGTQYEISYYFYGYSGGAKNIPVYLRLMTSNTLPQPDATLIAQYPPSTGGTTIKTGEAYTATFTAPASGTFYIGAQVNASYQGYVSGGNPPEMNGKIIFRNFSIKALQKATAPGALSAFTASVASGDCNKVNLAFSAPTLDADGASLSGNVTVNIYRQGEETPFFTSGQLAPGASATAVDASPLKGMTTYTAKAANASGEGVPAEVSLWVGEDIPLAASNVVASIGAAGKVTVSWSAPSAGVNGAFLDLSKLSYDVTRVADGVAVALEPVSATSFTDESLSDAAQTNVSYTIVAKSSGGCAAPASSNLVNYGPSLNLPFADSFARADFNTAPWAQQVVKNFDDASYQPEWSVIARATVTDNVTDDNPEGDEITISPVDRDGGMLRFNSSQVGKMSEAARGRLITPALDFKDMLNPVLTFSMFRETYYTTNPATNNGRRDDFVSVEARSANGDFVALDDAEFHRYGKQNDWVTCEVPLYKMAGNDRVQIAFNGAGMGGGPIYIDNVRIEERTAYDLQAVAFAGPSRVRCGEKGIFSLTVKNAGGFDAAADAYSVQLLCGGDVVATAQGVALRPGRQHTFSLAFVPEISLEATDAGISARIMFAADQDLANNSSDVLDVRVTAPLLPAVSDLTASASGATVSLSWSTPAYLPAETLIEQDGFETYDPFTINSFGDFFCYDLDNRVTFGIGAAAGVTYPGSGEKIAYQVFAPELTNIDEEELYMWAAHSGANMLVAPQAMASGNPVASNDWLVFPPLSGNAQTIKFFARSFSDNYSEFMQGFYSTAASASEADDFIPCPDGGEVSYSVPSEWTELSYTVPAGARRFALRHVSADGYAFMVDDVTYQRAIPSASEAGLQGYNVYCNGEKINPDLTTGRALTHTVPADGTYSYEVAAVYPAGESARSNMVELIVTGAGIDGVLSDGYLLKVEGLKVSCSADVELRLFSTAGTLVADANACVEAPVPGVYVLMVGSRAHKIVLR